MEHWKFLCNRQYSLLLSRFKKKTILAIKTTNNNHESYISSIPTVVKYLDREIALAVCQTSLFPSHPSLPPTHTHRQSQYVLRALKSKPEPPRVVGHLLWGEGGRNRRANTAVSHLVQGPFHLLLLRDTQPPSWRMDLVHNHTSFSMSLKGIFLEGSRATRFLVSPTLLPERR